MRDEARASVRPILSVVACAPPTAGKRRQLRRPQPRTVIRRSRLVEIQQAGDDTALEAIPAEAERLLAERNRDVWCVVTVGFFESLQNLLGHRAIDETPFTRRLGPEGRLAWEWLNSLWAGERPDPPYGWRFEDIG